MCLLSRWRSIKTDQMFAVKLTSADAKSETWACYNSWLICSELPSEVIPIEWNFFDYKAEQKLSRHVDSRPMPYALIVLKWVPLFRRFPFKALFPKWKFFITIKHSLRLFLAWMAEISVPSKLSIASQREATVGVMISPLNANKCDARRWCTCKLMLCGECKRKQAKICLHHWPDKYRSRSRLLFTFVSGTPLSYCLSRLKVLRFNP